MEAHLPGQPDCDCHSEILSHLPRAASGCQGLSSRPGFKQENKGEEGPPHKELALSNLYVGGPSIFNVVFLYVLFEPPSCEFVKSVDNEISIFLRQ